MTHRTIRPPLVLIIPVLFHLLLIHAPTACVAQRDEHTYSAFGRKPMALSGDGNVIVYGQGVFSGTARIDEQIVTLVRTTGTLDRFTEQGARVFYTPRFNLQSNTENVERFGENFAIDFNGLTMASSAHACGVNSIGDQAGRVYVWTRASRSDAWIPQGAFANGVANEYMGYTMVLDSSGMTMAAGAGKGRHIRVWRRASAAVTSSWTGFLVQVYDSVLDNTFRSMQMGLSSGGNRLIVLSPWDNLVRIFRWNGVGDYERVGIIFEASGQSLSSIPISCIPVSCMHF